MYQRETYVQLYVGCVRGKQIDFYIKKKELNIPFIDNKNMYF